MDTDNQSSSQPSTARYADPKQRPSKPALFCTGLMKSGCPSCLIAGIAILPVELAARGIKKLIMPTPDQSTTRH